MLKKPVISNDDEEQFECLSKIQLDGTRKAREVETMEKNTKEVLSTHEVDDMLLKVVQAQNHEKYVPSTQIRCPWNKC